MNNDESLAHAKWDCTYHIVWMPEYRRKVLYGQVHEEVRDALRQLVAAKNGVEIVEGSVCVDHVHMCLRIASKHSVAKAVSYLKGKRALIMFDRHPEWRRAIGRDRTLWAWGCYASTVGVNESVMRKCVRNQEDASKIADWEPRPAACRIGDIRSESCGTQSPRLLPGGLLGSLESDEGLSWTFFLIVFLVIISLLFYCYEATEALRAFVGRRKDLRGGKCPMVKYSQACYEEFSDKKSFR